MLPRSQLASTRASPPPPRLPERCLLRARHRAKRFHIYCSHLQNNTVSLERYVIQQV